MTAPRWIRRVWWLWYAWLVAEGWLLDAALWLAHLRDRGVFDEY